MTGPLPLDDVLRIVERRRRRRARVRDAAGPALSVAAVGVAGLVVVALQSGSAEEAVTPAAPISALPTAGALSTPAQPTDAPPTAGPGDGPPSFDPGYLEPGFLPALADFLFSASADDADADRRFSDAEELSRAWGLDLYPAAKAVVAKAALTRVSIDPGDRSGDDALVEGFAAAGFTDADADELAAAWETDERTARVVGGLLVEAGYAQG